MTNKEKFVIEYLTENGKTDIKCLSEHLIEKFGDKESRGLLANLIDSGCILRLSSLKYPFAASIAKQRRC